MERLRKPTTAIPGESGRGLFARACGRHNIPHAWMILQHVGATFRNRIGISENSDLDLDRLGEIIKVDPAALRDRTYPLIASRRRSFYGLELFERSFETRVRRFSPLAFQQSPHMRAIWEISDLPYCIEGWDILQSHCRCGARQGWTRMTKVHCCDDCGRPLAERVNPILIPVELRAALELPALLLSPLVEDQERGLAMLPAQLAGQERSTVYDTIIAIAKALTPRGTSADMERTEALHVAASAVLAWPNGMDNVARPSWILGKAWGRLLAKYDRLGRFNLSDVELVGIREAVAIGRASRSVIFAFQDDGHLSKHNVALPGRGTFDAFDVAELKQFADAYSDRLSRRAIAKVTGLPLYAVEQVIASGLLPTNGIRLTSEDPIVSQADFNAFVQQLAEGATTTAGPEAPRGYVPLQQATCAIGGTLKPWDKIFSAMLCGKLAFTISSGAAPLVRRISLAEEDMGMLRDLALEKDERGTTPLSATIHKQDALEVLNIKGDTPVLEGLPFRCEVSGKIYQLDTVLDRARSVITLPEIAQRTGWSISRAHKELLRRDVPLLYPGCWCRDTTEGHLATTSI